MGNESWTSAKCDEITTANDDLLKLSLRREKPPFRLPISLRLLVIFLFICSYKYWPHLFSFPVRLAIISELSLP